MAEPLEFVVARNPDPDSALPFLLRLPLEGGLVLKAREAWPATARVYCHPAEEWPAEPDVVESEPVRVCRRRGVAIDLVLDRSRNNRAQFVFTKVRTRPAIFWQTAKSVRSARPGIRVPTRRAAGLTEWSIEVDHRERYPYRFTKHSSVTTVRATLPAGDYAVRGKEGLLAAVERKSLPDLSKALVDGSLAFKMAELAAVPASAVVVEARYPELFKVEHVQPGWLPEVLARLQVRYPDVPIVFADTRAFAEEWTYRFLGAALRELGDDQP
ncbi:MAG TPA: ERCC4 domain-containing protein [Actinomycetota bacterium]|nr:ERCC4 domain-containing protein [Actinomycetota bacterium]